MIVSDRGCSFPARLEEVAPGQSAIDQEADRHGVDHGDRSRFGRCHDPAVDAAEDDHWHEQGGKGVDAAARSFSRKRGQRGLFIQHQREFACHPQVDHTEIQDDEQSRAERSEKAGKYRRVGNPAINNHRDARRDQEPKDRTIGNEGSCVFPRVAAALHLWDQKRSDRGHTREPRAGDRANDRAAHGGYYT